MFQISQVGGVLESSGPPLEDGHRDFEDWCILGWGIHENKWANSNDAKCILLFTLNLNSAHTMYFDFLCLCLLAMQWIIYQFVAWNKK